MAADQPARVFRGEAIHAKIKDAGKVCSRKVRERKASGSRRGEGEGDRGKSKRSDQLSFVPLPVTY